jgi:hypothetical protein
MNTIAQIKEVLQYDPNTGLFEWAQNIGMKIKKGQRAGGKQGLGYVSIKYKKKTYKAHRLAFALQTGNWPIKDIDHINGQRDDNRWINLRIASKRENLLNSKKSSTNKSGHKNIHFVKNTKRWRVAIHALNGKLIQRNYRKLEDAINKANELRAIHYKDFERRE